jgi:hypothetical protein
MAHDVQIVSYFTIPTDLSVSMKDWPEFRTGSGYSVDLSSLDGSEVVSVRLVEGEDRFVSVASNLEGSLFFRVLGVVIYSLSANSDNLVIYRAGE